MTLEESVAAALREKMTSPDETALWGAFPNTMTVDRLARHVIDALTGARVRLVELPEPTSVRNEVTDEGEPYRVAEWVTDCWSVCRFGDGELSMYDRIGPSHVTSEHFKEAAAAMLAAAEGSWP